MTDELKKRIQRNAKDSLLQSIQNCLKAEITFEEIKQIIAAAEVLQKEESKKVWIFFQSLVKIAKGSNYNISMYELKLYNYLEEQYNSLIRDRIL